MTLHNDLAVALNYHDRTKHHPHRYATSLGYLDWANQPNPFRRYEGSTLIRLDQVPSSPRPTYDSLFGPHQLGTPASLNACTLAQLFFDSFALSAWKIAGNSRWSLRANPSSGNLHPTEAYLLAGPIDGLSTEAALYHYAPFEHALELRRSLPTNLWTRLRSLIPGELPPQAPATSPQGCDLMIGLTSIHWREAWKYGERAYRYCQHDVGHAIAAAILACAVLGWKTRLLETIGDRQLAQLMAVDQQTGAEAEHPDCLLAIWTGSDAPTLPQSWPDPQLVAAINAIPAQGTPNQLSHHHQPWPVIDTVTASCGKPPLHLRPTPGPACTHDLHPDRSIGARQIIRQRRSAVAMDGTTAIPLTTFLSQMNRTLPYRGHPVWQPWPWPVSVHLALFVHRVEGLSRGLYWLDRNPVESDSQRTLLRPDFDWQRLGDCPESLRLYRLQAGDFAKAAESLCCQQAIAADGAYAVAMIAVLEKRLHDLGAWFYRRLFWECGMIGQILYLEAEAAGIRATGIGCFFDDPTHQLLGIQDHRCQSLYHFTVGGPVEDQRLQTLDAYFHHRMTDKRRSGLGMGIAD
jgi:SagB-type dehydrogenase family enzyme